MNLLSFVTFFMNRPKDNLWNDFSSNMDKKSSKNIAFLKIILYFLIRVFSSSFFIYIFFLENIFSIFCSRVILDVTRSSRSLTPVGRKHVVVILETYFSVAIYYTLVRHIHCEQFYTLYIFLGWIKLYPVGTLIIIYFD